MARGDFIKASEYLSELRKSDLHERYELNKGRAIAASLAYQKANPERAKAHAKRTKCKRYGLTIEQYDAILPSIALSIDHCHRTGAVRGLLCTACNSWLGVIDDDPAAVARAMAYLERAADARR